MSDIFVIIAAVLLFGIGINIISIAFPLTCNAPAGCPWPWHSLRNENPAAAGLLSQCPCAVHAVNCAPAVCTTRYINNIELELQQNEGIGFFSLYLKLFISLRAMVN